MRAALVGVLGLLLNVAALAGEGRAAPRDAAELFAETAVWTVHLTFTPEQWQAMEPKEPSRGGFGGGPPRGPGGFGPANFIAPTFISEGDADKDGKLSKDEFLALGRKWFEKWDTAKGGVLSADQLRAGLDASFTPQGGFGGRGPNLQGPEGKRNGVAAAAGIEFEYVHADIEFQGQVLKDVGVRYKGNGTWMQSRGSLKRSLKVETNHFIKGQKLAGVSKLNFHSNVTDASWMNEVLSHRLFREAGVPAPRTAYARVFITVPDKYDRKYVGLYSLVENIDKDFVQERYNAKGAAIFKPVTQDLFANLGDAWARYNQTYDPKTDLTQGQIQRVIEFSRLVTRADDAEFAAKLGDYLDLDEFARFMAVTTWVATMDSILSLGQNFYVTLHPTTHKFQFLPWDLDHSFGQFGMGGDQSQREQLSIHRPWRGDNRFLDRVFKVEAFKKLYLTRMEEFSRTICVPERFAKQVDTIAAAIRPAVKEESATKLARFDRVVAGQAPDPPVDWLFGDVMESGPRGPGGSSKPIKAFVTARAKSVLDQLAGRSEGLAQSGGRGGPDRGGRGRFGPGMFLAPAFTTALDANKNGTIARDEFAQGFAKWFDSWNTDKTGTLTDEQLRAGIDRDFAMRRPSFGRGFGGRDDGPPPPPQ